MATIPIVVYDACVLYPFSLRNVLMQVAADRLVRAHWTDEIHDEWIRNLLRSKAPVTKDRLERTRDLMQQALPDASVSGYEHHIESILMPDANDRHVVAAAIEVGAEGIVTVDRHFNGVDMMHYNLRKITPDKLLTQLFEQDHALLFESIARARANLSNSRLEAREFVNQLHGTGTLGDFCDVLNQNLDRL